MIALVFLIVIGGLAGLFYIRSDCKCTIIQREIDKAERELAALESDYVREMAHWGAMKTPEKLAEHLTRFGLEMKLARQDQLVRMNRDGRPEPNQVTVKRARERANNMASMASVSRTPARLSPSSRGVNLKDRTARR